MLMSQAEVSNDALNTSFNNWAEIACCFFKTISKQRSL